MNCFYDNSVQRYLARFEEILCQMAHKMLSQEIRNQITIDFIVCMIPHHQAAIDMCENLLKYTEYPPLQEMARRIIRMQTQGIAQMKEIASTTLDCADSQKDVACYMERYFAITNRMICRMYHAPRCANIDWDFIGEMIPHHEGAIAMCENVLQYCIDPRLGKVAQNIIQEQSQGVKELECIRKNFTRNY